ncbi:sulfite exporter TauE/SafE family protein [Lentibacter algarum]|nr:sulfite exporter TauE/SafE family protein [Lentibacter algarum]
MPEALGEALAFDGLVWLIVAVFAAGLVRGFSGFGSALIFVPVASKFMEPVWALICLTVMDIFGPIPLLRKAWNAGEPRDIARLGIATLLTLPLGLALLFAVPAEVFRYAVSTLAIAVPLLLITGFRYRGALTPKVMYGAGVASGVTGGAVGLPGPPVILLYAASTKPASIMRANTLVFLFAFDFMLLGWIALQGYLAAVPVWLGLIFIMPAMLGNMAGGALFDPAREKMYRYVAYLVVFSAAISSLPIWEG